MEPLKIAIVTDIHHGPARYTKRGADALPLLEAIGRKIADCGADLVVDLGDRISNADRDTDLGLMRDVAAAFDAMPTRSVHILGNHDLHYLSREENEAILNRPLASHSEDVKGRHLVFWQIDLSGRYGEEPIPSEDDLDWLRRDLAATELPAIVFSHIPLDGAAMTGNFYFQNNTDSATLQNMQQARDIIEASGKVELGVAGHVHWNHSSTIDGIRYLTVQSVVESNTTDGEAAGAWAEIELTDTLRWTVHGKDPLHYEAKLRKPGIHWQTPLPPKHILEQQSRIADPDHEVSGVILDMDGVLYRGDEPVDGSAEAVRTLLDHGLEIVYLTNNARRTPKEYAETLAAFDIDLDPSHILTSGMAVARYLADEDAAPKVHIVGSAALRNTILAAGAVESDESDYVVAGIDGGLKIDDLTPAIRHLAAGARLLASNPDAVIPTRHGPEPEAGPVVAFLEAASGKTARVFGKPDAAIFELAIERLGVARESVVMVGDTPATDIAGARAAGLRSILVASGNPAPEPTAEQEPTARFADLKAAVPFLTGGSVILR